MAARCAAHQAQDSAAKPNPQEQEGRTPGDSSKDSQAGGQPTGEGTVAKVQADVNKVLNLPAEWFLGAYVPTNRNLRALTNRERSQVYVRQTYRTGASYLKRLFAAGVDQARGVPQQWGGGFQGYGQRFGSRYGQFIIQNTLASMGDAVLRYEPRYDLCRCTGMWPRTRHAFVRNLVTYNATETEKRPQLPLYVATFSAGVLATTWKPGRESPWRNGAYAVAGQAGYGAITNWLQEFALDLGHKLSRNKGSQTNREPSR
ncbi:MAG TPA: hypothetical protein VEK33_16385 [Terriglobales bacterium]|nr:hypothetical protein [Terriglobales bacterium]